MPADREDGVSYDVEVRSLATCLDNLDNLDSANRLGSHNNLSNDFHSLGDIHRVCILYSIMK